MGARVLISETWYKSGHWQESLSAEPQIFNEADFEALEQLIELIAPRPDEQNDPPST